jgi:hypothetical protein
MPRTEISSMEIEPGESPDYGREKSGRCRKCNIRFIWPAKIGRLKDMNCIFCGSQLQLTTHLFKGETHLLYEKRGAKR